MRQERQTETETDAIDRGRSDRQRQERQTGTGRTDRNRYRNERGVQRGTNDVLRERESTRLKEMTAQNGDKDGNMEAGSQRQEQA